MTTLVSEMPIALSQQPRLVDDAASNARSRIMMSSGQQRESLAAKLLGAQKSDTEEANGSTDLLIQGLVKRLPKANDVWSLNDRAKWLRSAVSIFDLVYRTEEDDHRNIGVALTKLDAEPR